MTVNELFDESGFNLTDLRCMSASVLSRFLDTWCAQPQERAAVEYAVNERKATRWERLKSKARGVARKLKSAVKATGRFLKVNWGRVAVGALVVTGFVVAWKPMLVLSACVMAFSVYFLLMAGAEVEGDDKKNDKNDKNN